MERLTEKTVGCFEYALKDHKAVPGEFGTYDAFFDYSVAVKRLGHYEDTGLEPEEIADAVTAAKLMARSKIVSCFGVDADHVREMVEAEKEGRLAVLPCKVGDTLFDTYCGDIREKEVVSVGFMLSKSVKHMTIHANNFRGAITEIEMDRIGKDIFYTREAAEAALKGGDG